MINEQHNVIVVMPVYEDVEACSRLFEELSGQFGNKVFVIAVDDGSVKQPLEIGLLKDANVEGVVIKLHRNVGHQRAIAIGMAYASENMHAQQSVVVMDSDGEDLPSTIDCLLSGLDSDQIDVVVAQRKSRVESLRFKMFYFFYKQFFKVMTGKSISFGNFMALKSHALKRLVVMQELPIHVAAAVLVSKLRVGVCPLDRGPRYAGKSKMNFVGLALHGFKALMIFAEDVLVRVGIACAGIAALSTIGAIIAIILKFIGFSTPGWFSIALGVLVMLFLQTATLALMTLMITGVIRSGAASKPSYNELILSVLKT